MSKLDRHVASVRNYLAISRFLSAGAWALMVFAALVLVAIVVDRMLGYRLPRQEWFLYGGAGASIVVAMIVAFAKRPSAKSAAVAIDEKLGLREKISTALFIRNDRDPFAQAALKDAEQSAERVVINRRQHFPLVFPRPAYATLVIGMIAFLTALYLPAMDLFGRVEEQKKQARVVEQRKNAENVVKRAIATVEAVPRSVADNEAIKNAKIELNKLMNAPIKDPQQANRTAMKAMQDVQKALSQEVERNAKFAETQDAMKNFNRNLQPAQNEKGPVADAQRELAKGNFTEAINQLDAAVKNFDKMDKKEQEKAAQQMQNLAKQMQQAAGNPQQQQQQMQQKLQQMGMNQQQAQQMAQQMQQAAQGNQQAQQQLAQQAQQMMQQLQQQAAQGNQQAQQQLQQMQQMMNQMQAQANNQAMAQQMQQAAQQMAQAMQQGQQGQQQQGQQQQQMQQAMQQMQQQLQQMEAQAQDAAQIAAAQQAAQEAAEQAAGQCQGGQQGDQGPEGGKLGGRQDGAGQWAQGDPNNRFGNGMGGPGQGAGGRSQKDQAPFGVKQEVAPSQDNQKGKILASTFVKDNKPIPGSSKENLKDAVAAAREEAADEVDQERISKQAQKAVREYFSAMERDSDPGTAPATQPAAR